MKYADCPTVSVSVTVEATAATVWDLVSDITLPTRFSSEIRSVDWLDGATEPALGARFVGRSAHEAIGEWETTCRITDLDEGRRVECAEIRVTRIDEFDRCHHAAHGVGDAVACPAFAVARPLRRQVGGRGCGTSMTNSMGLLTTISSSALACGPSRT